MPHLTAPTPAYRSLCHDPASAPRGQRLAAKPIDDEEPSATPSGASAGPVPWTATRSRPIAASISSSISASGRWEEWSAHEAVLSKFATLAAVIDAWSARDPRCYQVVAALVGLGSTRGGDDDDAALAVLVILEDGIRRLEKLLRDVCEADEVWSTAWEIVKAAEPVPGPRAARFMLQRTRQRLVRAAQSRDRNLVSLDQGLGWDGSGRNGTGPRGTSDLVIAAPEDPTDTDPADELAGMLAWARSRELVEAEDVSVLHELIEADHAGLTQRDAQVVVGARRGVSGRTIRRRRNAALDRLRAAAPRYLADLAS